MNKIILIKVSGRDKPGITRVITQCLSSSDANILDIGQAVIHDQLALGMLVEIFDTIENSVLQEKLVLALDDMKVEINQVSLSDYNRWTQEQGKPRHILTLLSRKIEAEHIHRVTELTSSFGLNIDKISRLSGRIPIGDQISQSSNACIEFSLRGIFENEERVRSALLDLANVLDVDIAIQEDNMFRRNRRLVVFDMDSTLINAEVIDELAKKAGVGDKVSEITEQAMRGEIDFNQSFERRVCLLKGLSENALAEVADYLQLNEGAQRLVETLRRLGYKTAILSGGFTYFAKRLQQQLGFDYVYANELEIVDGVVTGITNTPIVDGNRKAVLLQEIAQLENIALDQVIAVGDGANDLPMLSLAGLGVAYNAKPIVKQSAQQSISSIGLDGILYLLGISDRELAIKG